MGDFSSGPESQIDSQRVRVFFRLSDQSAQRAQSKSYQKKTKKMVLSVDMFWLVVSNIFYVHPYLGKISNLTNIFQRG